MKKWVIMVLLVILMPICYSAIPVPEVSDAGGEITLPLEEGITYYAVKGDKIVASVRDSDVEYHHRDRLGSNVVTSEASMESESKTLPFGRELENVDHRFTFTGKERDVNSGLYYFGVRYYDFDTGRFTSTDPVQENHPYAYANNNPLKYVDPTGMDDEEKFEVVPEMVEDVGWAVHLLDLYEGRKSGFGGGLGVNTWNYFAEFTGSRHILGWGRFWGSVGFTKSKKTNLAKGDTSDPLIIGEGHTGFRGFTLGLQTGPLSLYSLQSFSQVTVSGANVGESGESNWKGQLADFGGAYKLIDRENFDLSLGLGKQVSHLEEEGGRSSHEDNIYFNAVVSNRVTPPSRRERHRLDAGLRVGTGGIVTISGQVRTPDEDPGKKQWSIGFQGSANKGYFSDFRLLFGVTF